jgi:D-alanyl-D-alanine carboxypeptidase (penicillin-binding protein 5/6)
VGQLTEIMRGDRYDDAPQPPQTTKPPVDPAVRRRRRRRRLITTASVFVLITAIVGGYVGWALNAPVGGPTASTALPDAAPGPAAAIALPQDGASAISVTGGDDYFGPDAATTLWPAVGGDDPRPIASITKLITALVILDKKPLAASEAGPTLTFDKADHALYDKYYVLGASIAAMPTGSTMSQHDALEMMLIVSACNYAEAVAEWAFGSQDAFLSATKRWLAANGLAHTRIVESTGIDARNTSSPSDMIALGRIAMANAVVAEIVGMPRLDVPGHSGANTNTLLGTAGVRGLKTGTLEATGANLLYESQLEVGIGHPLEITGVVLGGFARDSVDRDVSALLGSIAAGFHNVTVAHEGDVIGTYSTPWGASARMVLASDATVFTWSDSPITATMTTTDVTTGLKGEVVGSVTWTAGDSTDTVQLVLDADIEQPDDWWRLTHPTQLG